MPQTIEYSYASYLVRLWRQSLLEGGACCNDWQSEVDHIQSGQRWTFGTLDDLLLFLRQKTEESEERRSFISRFE
jgi:hypothetical protein